MQGFDKFLKNAMERQRGTADYAVVTKRGNKWIKMNRFKSIHVYIDIQIK